jgi:hypothetical protein
MRDRRTELRAICAVLLCVALACGDGGGDGGGGDGGVAAASPREGSSSAASQPAASLAQRWSTDSLGWNKAMLFHPEGDVLAFEKGRLLVLARDTGKVLDELPGCDLVSDGAFWLGDGRIALVCEDGVNLLHLPSRKLEAVLPLGQAPEVGHMAGGVLALAGGKRVLLVDTGSWKTVETFDLPHAVRDVAVSPDGTRIAVATHDRSSMEGKGSLLLVERGGAQRELHGEPAHAVAFSSDGQTLFAGASGFDGFFIDVASGEKQSRVKTGSWLTTAAFLTPELVAATGSDGLVLYKRGGAPAPTVLVRDTAVGMAAETGRVCIGTRRGQVHCFSREALQPSSYVAVHETGEPGAAPEPRAAPEPELTGGVFGTGSRQLGTIVSVSGDRVVLRASDNFPPVGSTGKLWKQTSKKLGASEIEFWLDIARVKILESGEGAVTLQVLEEKSVLSVNGRKQSHFTEGAKTKLEW